MGWTVPTYSFQPALGEPSNVRTCMFELIRGIRERRTIKGGTHASFYRADGTLWNAAMTMDHLYKIPVSLVNQNLVRIQDAIVDLLEVTSSVIDDLHAFFEDDTFTNVWTLESLEAEIGTSLHDIPLRPLEARFWQAQQDALDKLVYIKTSVGDEIGPTADVRSGQHYLGTIQDAWDDALADTPTTTPSTQLMLSASSISTALTNFASVSDNLEFHGQTSGDAGDVIKAGYFLQWAIGRSDWYTGDFACHIEGTAITLDGRSDGTYYEEIDADISDIPYGTDFSLSASHDSIPSTVPFTVPAADPFPDPPNIKISTIGMRILAVTVYLDLSSELSDQT